MKHAARYLAALCLISPGLWAAGKDGTGKDGLWEINTRMDAPGLPKGLAMPGLGGTMRVCIAEGGRYEPAEQHECQVLEQRQSGKKMFVKMRCQEGVTSVEHEQINPDRWRNKAVTESRDGKMTVESEGKRVGACDAAKDGGQAGAQQQMQALLEASGVDLAAMAAESRQEAAELGERCRAAVADWPGDPAPFAKFETREQLRQKLLSSPGAANDPMIKASQPEVPHCAKAKTDYCTRARSEHGKLSARPAWEAASQQHGEALDKGLRFCGIDPSPLLARHCQAAAQENDAAFVGRHCPEERKALAEKHCAGRAYSSVEPRFQLLCDRGGRSYSARPLAEPKKDARDPAVEQGVKQLKKLFGF